MCNRHQIYFMPLVFGCSGNVHEGTRKLLNVIAHRIYSKSDYTLVDTLNYVHERTSTSIQKVTAS